MQVFRLAYNWVCFHSVLSDPDWQRISHDWNRFERFLLFASLWSLLVNLWCRTNFFPPFQSYNFTTWDKSFLSVFAYNSLLPVWTQTYSSLNNLFIFVDARSTLFHTEFSSFSFNRGHYLIHPSLACNRALDKADHILQHCCSCWDKLRKRYN